ncbi:MAG: hypothetical protein ACRC5M_06850 [Anaeroplasmataceae bacterium]
MMELKEKYKELMYKRLLSKAYKTKEKVIKMIPSQKYTLTQIDKSYVKFIKEYLKSIKYVDTKPDLELISNIDMALITEKIFTKFNQHPNRIYQIKNFIPIYKKIIANGMVKFDFKNKDKYDYKVMYLFNPTHCLILKMKKNTKNIKVAFLKIEEDIIADCLMSQSVNVQYIIGIK